MLAGMGHGPYDESDSEQHEWNAQCLAYVDAVFCYHFIFRHDLHVFHVFNDESRQEDSDEEDSCDKPRAFLSVFLPIHPH